jgi:phenylalanyl-tRNA synthetase beta chain
MRLPADLGQVEILNPISVNQTMLRVHLLSGLMATFALNRTREMPQPIFEVGDVATGTEDSAAQTRKLGIGVMGPRADYAAIRSTVDALVHEGGLTPGYEPGEDHALGSLFLPGRVARVSADGTEFGVLGEVHPGVITAWGLDQPVVLAEIDVERLPVPVRG